MNRLERGGVELQHLAVIGQQAVDLNLHIRRLRIDGAAEPLLRERAGKGLNLLTQFH